MGEVVVTSTTIDDRFDSKRDEPSNVTVISGKDVDAAHLQNIIQILQSIPGVTADVDSGDSVKIKLRGIENQRYMGEKPGVAIVIDGVPVFERTGKVNIDLDNIESIRVIKGGASYLFGEDALSGAVIITTKRGAKYAGYTLGAEAGSFDYYKYLGRAGFSGKKASGHVQYTKRGADDYYYQGQYGSEYVSGNVQYYVTDSSDLTFGFERSQRYKDSHGNVTGKTQAETDPRSFLGRDYTRKYDVSLDKLNLTYSNNYTATGNLLVSGYQYEDHTLFWSAPQVADGVTGAQKNGSDDYISDNDYTQVQRGIKGEWRDGRGAFGWLGGVDLRDNNYRNFTRNRVTYSRKVGTKCTTASCQAGAVTTDDSTDEAVKAVYGELKFSPAKPLVLTVNGRYDDIDLDYSSNPTVGNPSAVHLSKSFNVPSWRGGVNYVLSENVGVYGNISTGFRAPTVQQLFGKTVSPTGNVENNPDLKPERALNREIGVRAKGSLLGVRFDAEAALYQIDRKDYILNTSGQYSQASVVDRYDNIGGVQNRGLELSLKTDPGRLVAVDVAYSYIQAKFTRYDNFIQVLGNPYAPGFTLVPHNATGNLVPRVPRHTLNTMVNWRPVPGFRLGLEMDAKSWSYADEINQEKLPGRTLFNLIANYDLKPAGGGPFKGAKWSFFARVDNLFDRRYWVTARGTNDSANPVTTLYDKVYNAEDLSIIVGKGQTWTAGVSATF
jgi:iron complex outermembrane receptor protein